MCVPYRVLKNKFHFSVVPRCVTHQEFDGRDEATPAYVALRGEVFDVSSKPEHYKKGGGYHLFAGHDASYSLATGSLDPADLEKRWACVYA